MTRAVSPCDFYQSASYRIEDSVAYLMKRIILSFVSQADKRLGERGLTSAQWGPLLRLQNGGASTVAELARWGQVDAGAMTRLLDRLERKGLVKRIRSTEDRRVVQVEITPAGSAAIVEVPAVLAEIMNLHLAGFSKTECVALKNYLARIVATGDALRESPEATAGARARPASTAPPEPPSTFTKITA